MGFFLIGASWANLGVAVFLGVMSTQIGFLGHDAGHGQIFETRRANRRLGLGIGNVLIGLSFGWWVPKHNAHHAHPNQVNRDPDIEVPAGGGAGTDGGRLPRLSRCLATRQAELFVPLMLLRSTGLYVSGAKHLLRRRDRAAVTECVLLAAHFAFYLTVVLWVLPLPEAAAFIAVHQAVFSLYLGCSFAPNHKGMPILDEDSSLGFARRQSSRLATRGRRVHGLHSRRAQLSDRASPLSHDAPAEPGSCPGPCPSVLPGERPRVLRDESAAFLSSSTAWPQTRRIGRTSSARQPRTHTVIDQGPARRCAYGDR